jgi:uncharacterized integral membrane protein
MTTDPQPASAQGEALSDRPVPENTPQVPPQQAVPEPAAPPAAAPTTPPPATPPAAAPTTPPPATPPAAAPLPPQHRIKRTRTSGIWVAMGFFAVVLLLLLIFILQNNTQVSVSYLGMHGHLPLGVALLLAAVCGVLLVVLAGAARISQLRAVARRHRRVDAKRAAAVAKETANPAR